MLQRSHRWSAFASGATLYTLVFIFAHHFWSVPLHMRHGQPELLLFLVPGVAIALLQPASPMVSTLWSAIAGTLLGMSWVMLTEQVSHTPLMGLAWLWCATGSSAAHHAGYAHRLKKRALWPVFLCLYAKILFGPGSKFGVTTDVPIVDKNLRHRGHWFTGARFQIGFSDAGCLNINILVVEAILVAGQLSG